MLSRYQRQHPTEEAAWRFRRFVSNQPRCFERDCWEDGHVTASAALLDPSRKFMLMTLHRKLGMWLQLGGHADGNPDPLAVARREAEEESGLKVTSPMPAPIDVDVHAVPAYGTDPAHYHYDMRFVLVAEHTAVTATSESEELRWVPLDNIASVTNEESILRLAAKCRAWLGT